MHKKKATDPVTGAKGGSMDMDMMKKKENDMMNVPTQEEAACGSHTPRTLTPARSDESWLLGMPGNSDSQAR